MEVTPPPPQIKEVYFPTHILTTGSIYPKVTVLLHSKAIVLKYHLRKKNIPNMGVQRPKGVYILKKICLFSLRK